MDPICLLIEAVVVEICSLYVVNKWREFAGNNHRAEPQRAARGSTCRKQIG